MDRGRIVLAGPSRTLADDRFMQEAYLGVTPAAAAGSVP
jgi:ABC-type branched-subunit amino acid transport system ATPase component